MGRMCFAKGGPHGSLISFFFLSLDCRMLVLFETPAGYALFSLKNEGKLEDVNNLYKEFETPEKANKM